MQITYAKTLADFEYIKYVTDNVIPCMRDSLGLIRRNAPLKGGIKYFCGGRKLCEVLHSPIPDLMVHQIEVNRRVEGRLRSQGQKALGEVDEELRRVTTNTKMLVLMMILRGRLTGSSGSLLGCPSRSSSNKDLGVLCPWAPKAAPLISSCL